jgi:hypothetical protein
MFHNFLKVVFDSSPFFLAALFGIMGWYEMPKYIANNPAEAPSFKKKIFWLRFGSVLLCVAGIAKFVLSW